MSKIGTAALVVASVGAMTLAAALAEPSAMPAGVSIGPALQAPPEPQPALDPQEDDPGWDCRIHGDRVCGTGNAQNVAPGLYDRWGNLIDPAVQFCWLLSTGQTTCGPVVLR